MMYKVAFVLLFTTMLVAGCTTRDNDIHGAWVSMQHFVEKRLSSPSSADFPFGGASNSVVPQGEGRYKIESYVDAKNLLGGVVRIYFSGVIIKGDEDDWMLESLDLYR